MSIYKKLDQDFSGDVSWLRKKLVKKMLDENSIVDSYELFSSFLHQGGYISELEEEFIAAIYKVKSILPTSTTSEISGDLMSEVIERESNWADGWQKYYEHKDTHKKQRDITEEGFYDIHITDIYYFDTQYPILI